MTIKILTGHYYNLTYIIDEVVSFDSKLKSNEVYVIAQLEHDISTEEQILKSLINKGKNISGKYTGKSRIDGSPIFIIDLKVIYREIAIDEILKT